MLFTIIVRGTRNEQKPVSFHVRTSARPSGAARNRDRRRGTRQASEELTRKKSTAPAGVPQGANRRRPPITPSKRIRVPDGFAEARRPASVAHCTLDLG